MKNGRLIGQEVYSEANVHTAGDCARKCLNLPEHSCLSINYDYGKSGLCELLKFIEGHDHIVSQVRNNWARYLRYIKVSRFENDKVQWRSNL